MGILSTAIKVAIGSAVALMVVWLLAMLFGGVFYAVWGVFTGIWDTIMSWVESIGGFFTAGGAAGGETPTWWQDMVDNWDAFWGIKK